MHKSGYLNVQLWNGGQFWSVGVHQLVLLAHVGPVPDGEEVRHKDGDRTRNVLANLEYGTHLANMRDRDAHGGTALNERNGKVKHSNLIVEIARAMHADGHYATAIGRTLGIHPATVQGWLGRRTR